MNNKQKLIAGTCAAAGTFGVLVASNAFKLRWHIPREYYKCKYIAQEKLRHECEVLFIGDSITWLYKLGKHFPSRDFVNRGISGDRTTHILSRCEHTFSNIRAKKIVLLAGVNDFSDGRSSFDVTVNLFKIIDLAKKYNPEAEIFVESIYPVNNNGENKRHDNFKDKILEVNRMLEENSSGLSYTYIDMYSALRTESDGFIEEYTYDGLHPNENGYQAITQVLNRYI